MVLLVLGVLINDVIIAQFLDLPVEYRQKKNYTKIGGKSVQIADITKV